MWEGCPQHPLVPTKEKKCPLALSHLWFCQSVDFRDSSDFSSGCIWTGVVQGTRSESCPYC